MLHRLIRSLPLLLWAVLSASWAFALPGPLIEDARLFVSRPDATSLLTPAQPGFERALSDASDVRALAVDATRQLAWTRTEDRLVRFDQDGETTMDFVFERRGPDSRLAVVPSDGSLWLAEGTSLRAVGPGGQLLHDLGLEAPAVDLTIDAEAGLLWVATAEMVSSWTAVGGVRQTEISLQGLAEVAGLVPVPGTTTVWIAHAGGLDALSDQVGPPMRATFDAGIDHLVAAVDGDILGGFWAASGSELYFLDPHTGTETWSRPAFGAGDEAPITALALDPVTLSAWVSDGRRLVELTAAFRVTEHYDFGVPAAIRELVVLRPFRDATPPTIEILSPVQGQTVTETRRPRIELRVTAGDFQPRPGSLRLRADGADLGVECARHGDVFSCAPLADLPEGSVVLTATIEDEDGRQSLPATVSFTVRTDAPTPGGELGDDSGKGMPESDVYTPIVSPRGVRPHTSFVAPDDVDFVDTSSGNVTITLPLGQRYQVGPLLEYQFQLVNNSRVWEYHNACDLSSWCAGSPQSATFALTNPANNAGLGWEMHFGRLFAPDPPNGLPLQDRARWPNHDLTEPNRWMYVSPTGATHFLYPLPGRPGGLYSKDGSYLRMVQRMDAEIEIQFPGGLVSVFEKTSPASGDESLGTVFCGNGVSGCWRFRETRDLDGNSFAITYSTNAQGNEIWRLEDSTGRFHQMIFDRRSDFVADGDCPADAGPFCTASGSEWGDLRRILIQVNAAAFGDTRARYVLRYWRKRIQRGCPHDIHLLPRGTGSIRLPMLDKVLFPDLAGTENDVLPYLIENEAPAGGSGSECSLASGTVSQLTLPTGGKIAYDFQAWSFPTRCDYSTGVPSSIDTTYVAAGIRQRKLIRPSGAIEGDWLYSSGLRFLAPVGSGPLCRRADYRVTTVDGPIDGDGGGERGWKRTKFFHSVYDGPKDPLGPPNAPPISQWQVQDHGLPYTKECHPFFPEVDCTWNEDGQGLRFLSTRTFECLHPSAQAGDVTRGSQGTCIRQRSKYVRYGAEWTGVSCDKDPPKNDGAECYKADPVRVAETTVFHDDLASDGTPHDKWVDTEHSNFRGAGNFLRTTVTDDFQGDPGFRWEETLWDVSHSSPSIDPVSGYVDPGTPSSYLPAVTQPWLLRTYTQKKTRGRHTTGNYVTTYRFDAAGRLECSRRRRSPGSDGIRDRVVKLVRGTDPTHDLGLVVEEIVAGGPLASLGSGPCAVQGSASAGSRFRFGYEYRYHALSRSWPLRDCEPGSCTQLYPNTYRADIDRNTGLPSATYNPADQRTSHNFDPLGRLTSSVPEGSLQGATLSVTYGYDDGDAVVEETQTRGGQELTWQKTTFDEFGRLEIERRRRPDGGTSRRQRTYDGAGNLRRLSTWQKNGHFDLLKSAEHEHYDVFGRPWRMCNAAGQLRRTTYNGIRIATHKVWFRKGAPDVPSGAKESRTTEIFDAQGQKIDVRVEETDQTGFLHRTLTTYDPYGQLVRAERKQSDSGPVQVKAWNRDARGLLIKEILPEVGTITYWPNALGLPTRKTQGPFDLRYEYDQAARLIRIRDNPNGPIWKEWVWADTNAGSNYRKGKVVRATRYNRTLIQDDWIIETAYEYRGALGNVSARQTSVDAPASGNPSFQESYTWDAIGNLTGVTYPSCVVGDCFDPGAPNLSVTHTYVQGLQTQVDASLGGISAAYQYHPNFQLSRIDYGNGMDGLFDQGTNGMARPQRIRYRKSGGAVIFNSGTYKYDPMQNVEQMRRSNADRSTFQYDAAGRLLYGRIVQNGADAWQEYHYDEFDSIYETRTDGGLWEQWPVNPYTNRLNEADKIYDTAGNLTRVGHVDSSGQPLWELSYDPFQQSDFLERCVAGSPGCLFPVGGYGRTWALHYGYDADDRRVITVDGNASTVTYSLRDLGGQVLREYSGPIGTTAQHRKDFVYGAEGLVASRESSGVERYFHKDHLGSPRLITNAAEGVDDRQHFYPYGAQIAHGKAYDEPTVKFTGHQRDAHGLTDYMMGRTCAYPLFRFTSVDPGRDGWNLYSYGASNPIKYVDPDGSFAVPPIEGGALDQPGIQDPAERRETVRTMLVVLAAFINPLPGPEDVAIAAAAGTAKAATSAARVGGFASRVRGFFRKLRGKSDEVSVEVPRSRYPEGAAHIEEAQAAGHPRTLTIDRPGTSANRRAAQAGHERQPGMDLDEYPPAMFREGGAGASVRPISPAQNRGMGACIGNQCRGLADGTQVDIIVVD